MTDQKFMHVPTSQQLLDVLRDLARDIPVDTHERPLVERFVTALGDLFPDRMIAVRTVDIGRDERVVCAIGGTVDFRVGIEFDPLVLKPSSVAKTRLRSAVVESAHVRVREGWDNPFAAPAVGFALPLAARGELYGVLDVGYAPGFDGYTDDEPLVIPIANQLAVALRNERLHRDVTSLRDHQASLIEQANALIVGVGTDWRINVCNRAFCDLVGVERNAIIGTDLREFATGGARGPFAQMFRRGMRKARESNVHIEFERASSGAVQTVWSVAPVMSHGQIRAVVGVGQDQTRIIQLQNQVVQAEKLATLGQLAAGVVHELNNPLTSISVYADYLLKRAESGDESWTSGDAEKLIRIRDSARRIQAFAKDLVAYSRPGQSTVEAVTLSPVVKQSLSFCEHLFGDIELRTELTEPLPPVFAVPAQVEQIVINLVTNAVHAITGPGGRVRVATYAADDAVHISVEDTGPGIAATDRDRVFEPFFTTKTDGQGTGLGLSIVANIVEQLGAKVAVSEGTGGGAVFTVSFPVADR